jgi:hypothetical protein
LGAPLTNVENFAEEKEDYDLKVKKCEKSNRLSHSHEEHPLT